MNFLDYVIINPTISLKKNKEYPFIEMANVNSFVREPKKIEKKVFSSGVKFADGDTVIARITPCLQNGKGFYCHDIGVGFGSTEYLVFRPKDNKVDNKYLYYLMQTSHIRNIMIKSMVGSTGRQRVNNRIFNEIEVNFPDIDIQRKIGKVLSAYDDLIENNQKQIKLLEEAAQRLYKEWFVDLHFPDYENTPIIDGVPEGWKRITIKDLSVLLRRGISPKYNDTAKYNVINQKCIRQTVMDIKESRKQEKSYLDEMNLQDSDIVICSTGAGTLGRVGQVFGEYPATTFDSHITLVRAKEEVGKQFLFQSLKYKQPLFMTLGQGSTNQLELSKRIIENYDIIYPTDKIANTFECILQPIHEKITSLIKVVKSATEARDRLLPKLMSGELKV